jgi:hypothetical protein
MGALKKTVRHLKERFLNLGSQKVFAIIIGAILLPIVLEWLGLGSIAALLVGLYVIAGMILLYATLR